MNAENAKLNLMKREMAAWFVKEFEIESLSICSVPRMFREQNGSFFRFANHQRIDSLNEFSECSGNRI